MDTGTLATTCPDLGEKLRRLEIVVIEPHDIHAFLAGVYGWNPQRETKAKRKRKLAKCTINNNPIYGKGIGFSKVISYE
jgi:hypothetical protein